MAVNHRITIHHYGAFLPALPLPCAGDVVLLLCQRLQPYHGVLDTGRRRRTTCSRGLIVHGDAFLPVGAPACNRCTIAQPSRDWRHDNLQLARGNLPAIIHALTQRRNPIPPRRDALCITVVVPGAVAAACRTACLVIWPDCLRAIIFALFDIYPKNAAFTNAGSAVTPNAALLAALTFAYCI